MTSRFAPPRIHRRFLKIALIDSIEQLTTQQFSVKLLEINRYAAGRSKVIAEVETMPGQQPGARVLVPVPNVMDGAAAKNDRI